MADMIITCAHCGAETAISEYVDPDMAACRACGKTLDVPRAELAAPKPPPPKSTTVKKDAPLLERATQKTEGNSRKRRKRIHERMKILAWSPGTTTIWIIFIVGALLLGVLRFVLLPGHPNDLQAFQYIGLLILAVLHLAICVDAFSENVLNGMFALVIPGYSLFYLFTQCDSYILRLAMGIMIVPFGLDACIKCIELAKWLLAVLEKSRISSD